MTFFAIIPARYAASRLPGKPLLDIAGKPMIQHVYESAIKSGAKEVFIATDNREIQKVSEMFGARVFMTSEEHRSGTERIHEVVQKLGLSPDDVVVNVQADEPLIPASAISQVAVNLSGREDFGIATLCEAASCSADIDDPNVVKVVMNKFGEALYFSRARIPYFSNSEKKDYFRHIGIYAYQVEALNQFVSFPSASYENTENLEQLRALYNGIKIHVEVCSYNIPAGVDTQKDLEIVRASIS